MGRPPGLVTFARVVTAGTCLVVVALSCGGCTVPSVGEVAVGLDSAGNPAVAVAVCDHQIDGVSVALDGDDEAPNVADLHFEPALTAGAGQWSLVSDRSGDSASLATPLDVSAISSTAELLPLGWTDDNAYSLDGPTFSPSDLAGLKPGQFMAHKTSGDAAMVVSDVAQWAKQVCSES